MGAAAVGGAIGAGAVGGAMGVGVLVCAITGLVAKTSALRVRFRVAFVWTEIFMGFNPI